MKDIKILRMEVKKLRIDNELDYKGSLQYLCKEIGAVNYNSFSMAMSGFRNGKASYEILEKCKEYLLNRLTNN